MTAAVILYGSRARGDARPESDVDLLVAKVRGSPEAPKILDGASIHFYPQDWLMRRAEQGDLFVAHVVTEGVGLYDPGDFLQRLRSGFTLKHSYKRERDVAAGVVRLLISRDWGFENNLRRRYFWALRTIGAAISAESGKPVFSSVALEQSLGIPGIANHVEMRENATFEQCKDFGCKVLQLNSLDKFLGTIDVVKFLLKSGDIGTSTVRMFETHEAQEFGASALYF